MGNGAMPNGPKLPRPSSTLPTRRPDQSGASRRIFNRSPNGAVNESTGGYGQTTGVNAYRKLLAKLAAAVAYRAAALATAVRARPPPQPSRRRRLPTLGQHSVITAARNVGSLAGFNPV
jgi:hypothetical protein